MLGVRRVALRRVVEPVADDALGGQRVGDAECVLVDVTLEVQRVGDAGVGTVLHSPHLILPGGVTVELASLRVVGKLKNQETFAFKNSTLGIIRGN